jgi:hypothetical protein
MIEASKYAIAFLENKEEQRKIIDKIRYIRPDRVILVFEEYCKNSEEEQDVKDKIIAALKKVKSQAGIKNLQVSSIIACDIPSFKSYPTFSNCIGWRTVDALKKES